MERWPFDSAAVGNTETGKLCTASNHARKLTVQVGRLSLVAYEPPVCLRRKKHSAPCGPKIRGAASVAPNQRHRRCRHTHSLIWLVLSQGARATKLLDNVEAFRFHISIIYDATLGSSLDRVISHECGRATLVHTHDSVCTPRMWVVYMRVYARLPVVIRCLLPQRDKVTLAVRRLKKER